jgi:glycosyltransferase involved in cell wall biosynthesis
MTKTVSIIGTAGVPAKYGGFETLAEYLVRHLGEKYNLNVFCSSKTYENKQKYFFQAKLFYINLSANGLSSIPYDFISIIRASRHSDTILILGVSGAMIIPFLRLFSKVKIVTNIDGIEWKRNKWNFFAKIYLRFQERIAVKFSNSIVADNKGIQDYIFDTYNIETELIAYGSDHARHIYLSDEIRSEYNISDKYAFTVCRIEPENNIHLILEAFKESTLELIIVGNWNDSSYGTSLRKEYRGYNNIKLKDPIYDQEILNSIRSNCKVYLHGHSAGGTNPSLVEAMQLGLPIICFGVKYNVYTTKGQAKYFNSGKELKSIINRIDESEMIGIGQKMKQIAEREYTWEIVSEAYSNLF